MRKIKETDSRVGFYSTNLGANGVRSKESKHRGYTYKTSNSLIENIIAKKELSLFSALESSGPIVNTSAPQEYTDKKGKRVNLTPFQLKLITAFAEVVDTMLGEDMVKTYITRLPANIEDRVRSEESNYHKPLPNSIRCFVDIKKLTRLVYSRDRVGGKDTEKVRNEITRLSELLQIYKYKDSRGGVFTVEAPIITLGKRIKYTTKDGVEKINQIEIYFEDVFVYEINNRYSLSPINILQLWNKTGVQTQLFTMLLFLLQSVRGNIINKTLQNCKNARTDLKRRKLDPEEIEIQISKIKETGLTYSESISSLLERIDSKKYYRGKSLRGHRLEEDLVQATNALLSMGIISRYYESTGASGARLCNFVINDNWLTDEAAHIQNIQAETQTK